MLSRETFGGGERPTTLWLVVGSLALLGLLTLGVLVRLFLLLQDDDMGGPFGAFIALVVLATMLAVAMAFFILSWAYSRGHRWAWRMTVLLTLLPLLLFRVPWDGDHLLEVAGAWIAAVLALLVQVFAWLPATRRAFRDQRIRIEE